MKRKKLIIVIVSILLIIISVVVNTDLSSSHNRKNPNILFDTTNVSVGTEIKNDDSNSIEYIMYDYINEFATLEYPSNNEDWSYKVYIDNTGTYQSGFVELTECRIDKNATDIAIPEIIDGYPVICMGESLLYGYESLERLKIPDTIINIGDRACYKCYSLSNINIPNSITVIGDNAFTYHNFCGIGELVIPEGVIEIGESAFYTNTGKEGYYNQDVGFAKVILPKSLERINYNAFQAEEVVVLNPNLEFVTSYEEDFAFNYNAVVYGYSSSTAAEYCAETGNSFKVIE